MDQKMSRIDQFVEFRRKKEAIMFARKEFDIRISKYLHTWIPRTFCYPSIQILNKLRYQTIQNVEFRRKKEAIMINRKTILR